MIIKDVTDVLVWQKSQVLANTILEQLNSVQDSLLKQETLIATLAIPRRIAFGFAMWSQ